MKTEDMLDCTHGNNTIEHRLGKAYGSYTVDVSPWGMSYIIGREINLLKIK